MQDNRDKLMIRDEIQIPPEQIIFSNPPRPAEEQAPLWVKIFGGSIVSIAFLCVITLTGYIVSNINSLQSQINALNGESMTKKEFNERERNMWNNFNENMKIHTDGIQNSKERLNSIEQQGKERLTWMEKCEVRLKEYEKTLETANKDIAGYKERLKLAETQATQYHEESKQFQKELQALRERLAAIESKK